MTESIKVDPPPAPEEFPIGLPYDFSELSNTEKWNVWWEQMKLRLWKERVVAHA
jgi:hypothetical protein